MFSNALERQGSSDSNLDHYWDFFGNPQRQFQEERKEVSPRFGSKGHRVIRDKLREGTPAPDLGGGGGGDKTRRTQGDQKQSEGRKCNNS